MEPDALTTVVKNVPTPEGNALSALFPTEYKPTNTIDWSEIILKNRTAKYRAFDGRIVVSERDSGSSKRVKLAPLSTSIGVGEYERLQLEFASMGGTFTERLVDAIYNDGIRLTNEILNRIELAWGDVLLDGKLTINENGFESEADYGLPANHMATAATLWSDITNAKPLTDLQTWADIWTDTNGGAPGKALTSRKVIRLMLKNKEIIDAEYGATAGRTSVSLTQLNGLLEAHGLPVMLPAYDTKLHVDGADTRVLPDNRVIMLPDNTRELGYMAYGMSATALELLDAKKTDYSFEESAGIVGVVIKDGPPFRQFTYVDAVGQPVLEDAKKLFVSTVA
ncbi:major capsid protein [Nocardia cyriacigeorgica]|uniref:major capsid protein n=1 Tax=Nocardia cyriacigeorgica TaxID=135487 RepID=UPI002457E19C|nr:major capsid protein [Nocardia cyriacigeorgica]